MDTVDLDSSSYGQYIYEIKVPFFRDAGAALSALGRWPLRKLSVFMKGKNNKECQNILGENRMMDAVLINPALRLIEDLHIGFQYNEKDSSLRYIYELPLDVLPAHTLRSLDLHRCHLEMPLEAGAKFPRLASLRLYRCSMPMHHLEALTRAAPNLAILHIECQDFYYYCPQQGRTDSNRLDLHCPNLTALTLAYLHIYSGAPIGVFAPCLCTIRYNRQYTEFTMKLAATNLMLVDLNCCCDVERNSQASILVWQFLRSLRNTKALKLHVIDIEDVVLDETMMQDQHLAILLRLKHLEFGATFDPGCKEPAADAIATLLHCCPVSRGLQLRLMVNPWSVCHLGGSTEESSAFDVSMDLFRRRRSMEVGLMVDDANDYTEVRDLHGLTDCLFDCLHYHLKNVTLQFDLRELNSFEVCLAKFFAEKCKIFEVLRIEDGDKNFLSHVNWKVDRWRLNAALERSNCK